MKEYRKQLEAGFSAVELLITLFIASIFLFAGYQLYTQVLKDGSDAGKTAQMSNLVYERMRAKAAQVTESAQAGCAAANQTTEIENPTVSGFKTVQYTITVDCPYSTQGALSDLFHISVSASYNDGVSTKAITHATYAS